MSPSKDWIALQEDLRPFRDKLRQAAETVVTEDVSNYPVFLAYPGQENTIGLGIHVFEAPTARGQSWSVHLTTLEELVARQVVLNDKVDNFRKVYRNTPDSLCFLIFTDGEARFGFIPKR